jgi:hypothetical protein
MHLNHNSAAGDEFFSGIATNPDAYKKTLDKPAEPCLDTLTFFNGSNHDGRTGAQKHFRLVAVGQHKRGGLPIVKDTGTG